MNSVAGGLVSVENQYRSALASWSSSSSSTCGDSHSPDSSPTYASPNSSCQVKVPAP